MRREFVVVVKEVTDGAPNEADAEPPALVRAEGLSGEEVRFALRGTDRRVAGSWYGRRARVTVETMDGKD